MTSFGLAILELFLPEVSHQPDGVALSLLCYPLHRTIRLPVKTKNSLYFSKIKEKYF